MPALVVPPPQSRARCGASAAAAKATTVAATAVAATTTTMAAEVSVGVGVSARARKRRLAAAVSVTTPRRHAVVATARRRDRPWALVGAAPREDPSLLLRASSHQNRHETDTKANAQPNTRHGGDSAASRRASTPRLSLSLSLSWSGDPLVGGSSAAKPTAATRRRHTTDGDYRPHRRHICFVV